MLDPIVIMGVIGMWWANTNQQMNANLTASESQSWRDTDKSDENFLQRLIRHQNGVAGLTVGETPATADQMLDRFTRDLWKLAQDGGLTMSDKNPTNADLHELSNALIAFAMQKYYEEKDSSAGYNQELFTAAERGLIQALLPSLRDWTVQAGQGGMTATDTLNRGAFLLGGKEADTLTGGAKADLLVGNAGDDTLDGGNGSDVLLGGKGADTYKYASGDAAGLDTVQDSDGRGRIEIDGQAATGGQQFGDERVYRDGAGRLYAKLDNNRLVIDGGLLVEHWQAGRLGIELSGPAAEAPLPQTTRDIVGDLAPTDFDADEPGVQGGLDGLLNIITVPEEAAPDRIDPLFDSAGNDHLQGLGGDDIITALRGGDDLVDGGTGSDTMMGGAGDDVMLGGEGGNDRLYADAQTSVAQAIAAGNGQPGTGQKADWLAGGAGDDLLIGNAGNNLLSGGGGSDLLIGGAGDDYLLGDMDIWPVVAAVPVNFDEIDWFVYPHEQQWQVIRNASPHHIEYIFQHRDKPEDPADGGADVIYGGNGNDVAFAGGGNDIVFGEAGNDELSGCGGGCKTASDAMWSQASHDAAKCSTTPMSY
jgi:Ca2+-binding RTX toxin-like protein